MDPGTGTVCVERIAEIKNSIQPQPPNWPGYLQRHFNLNLQMWQHGRYATLPHYEHPGPGLRLYEGAINGSGGPSTIPAWGR